MLVISSGFLNPPENMPVGEFDVLDPVQGVFQPPRTCSQDRLWSHHEPDQNKALPEYKLTDDPFYL